MLGTFVNTACIIVGSSIGSILKKKISPNYQECLYTALGLCSIAIGLKSCIHNMSDSKYPVLFIVSLAIGSAIGTRLNLSGRFYSLIAKHSNTDKLVEGLSTAILLFCIGTLSILGPVQSALENDNTYLFTNALLDLVTSAVLASTYGIGIMLAAPVLFCWQSIFYVTATISVSAISPSLLTELQIVGGILITATGLSILKVKDCKTLNMIPSLFVPIVFFIILHLLGYA